MIEILPPLGKYKYDTWRRLSMKCYIDNSMRWRSCIRNINSGHQLLWFTTRSEIRGTHGCDEHWNARDMRFYTGSGHLEDNNPMSCVRRLYYDCLGRDPLYPSFYRIRGVWFTWKIQSVTVVPDPDSISTCHINKIWFYSYLLNRLGYGPPSPCP
jgi:hypothetical protein